MSKRVQLLGHVAELANQFVGLIRELTVDTDNAELRLHDGVTPGGRKFLDRDANDNRYQARSVELDGLLGWEPSERGFTVRLGPSTYRLREITVNPNQLTVARGNGYLGNPLIGIAATINTDHTFAGEITFELPIIATGGLLGNVTGNLTGNVTGNVVGNVTGNLTGNAAGNHTGSFTGDLDTEGHTVNMGDGQIQLAWLEAAITNLIITSGVPVGTVVAFAGTLEEIPDNWRVCDGTDGTPDLRERFIIGVGPDYAANQTGGAFTHSHAITVESGGAHTHPLAVDGHALTIAELPAHYHGMCDNITRDVDITSEPSSTLAWSNGNSPGEEEIELAASGTQNAPLGRSGVTGSGNAHTHTGATTESGTHAHDASSATASSLPPYYALVYIMKGA